MLGHERKAYMIWGGDKKVSAEIVTTPEETSTKKMKMEGGVEKRKELGGRKEWEKGVRVGERSGSRWKEWEKGMSKSESGGWGRERYSLCLDDR